MAPITNRCVKPVTVAAAAVLVASCQAPPSSTSKLVRTANSSSTSTAAAAGSGVRVTVTATVDGDTFRAVVGGRSQRIRILGINAPEVSHNGVPEQCGGEAARTALDKMIWHKAVTLTRGPGSDDHDQYGRPLRYVELGGVDVGLAMIQAGRASEYHPRSDATESRAAEYVAAQRVAMKTKRGQWATCTLSQEGKR